MSAKQLIAGTLLLVLAAFVVTGATSGQRHEAQLAAAAPEVGGAVGAVRARASLRNVHGSEIGVAVLLEELSGVRIAVDIHSSLHPGDKGFHIHEVGTCAGPDFESAGDHFNPRGASHGFRNPAGPHAGDLPNLEAESAYGLVDASLTNRYVTLLPAHPNSLFDENGSSLVIHAGPDDFRSQPDGGAGVRVACGVIEPS